MITPEGQEIAVLAFVAVMTAVAVVVAIAAAVVRRQRLRMKSRLWMRDWMLATQMVVCVAMPVAAVLAGSHRTAAWVIIAIGAAQTVPFLVGLTHDALLRRRHPDRRVYLVEYAGPLLTRYEVIQLINDRTTQTNPDPKE